MNGLAKMNQSLGNGRRRPMGMLFLLCFIGSQTGFSDPGPVLTRRPYLQRGTQTNIVVRWRTDVPTDSRAVYGTDPGLLDRTAADSELTTNHIVLLLDLLPGTRYYYAVGNSEETLAGGPQYQFVTAPAAPRPTRIWAIGDSGTASVGYFGSYDVRSAYYEYAGTNRPDVWLMLGDNAYDIGTDAQYQVAVFDTYPDMLRRVPVWPAIGNHETYSADLDGHFAYLDIFTLPMNGEAGGVPSGTPRYYSFDYSNIHFVCLDSETSDTSADGPMLTWLRQDLEATTQDWLIAFWHSPPYSKGSHDSDRELNLIMMRTNVVPVLESYGVDLVLCGHSHNYERSFLLHGHYGFSDSLLPSMIRDAGSGRPDDTGAYLKVPSDPDFSQGTVYVVAGSSGWATFVRGHHPVMHTQLLEEGSVVIDIDGNRLDAIFLRETAAVEDYFTIIKNASPEPFRIVAEKTFNEDTVLYWKSRPGQFYQVENTLELKSPNWLPVSGAIRAYGATTAWTNSIPNSLRSSFFRIVEVSD
jgi:Calcineurin-like phosphoesterase/Purple acid Phosphatase, N-terminal domain